MGWKERADTLLALVESGMSRDDVSAQHLALVNERLDAEDARNKVWMVMPYRCDKSGCGSIQWYEAEVGVEGPPNWRDDGTYLASPFTAGRCARCGGTMMHVMGADVVFNSASEPGAEFTSRFTSAPTYADRMFRVPREPVTYVTQGCDDDGHVIYGTAAHAFLATPMHAIRRALERSV